MTKLGILFFASYTLFIVATGICCRNKQDRAADFIDNTQQSFSIDSIIDPIPSPGCEILLTQKSITISSQRGFLEKSTATAIVNVVISKDGKLDSWELIYLRIVKGEKEIYLFNQTTRSDGKYPNEIEFICDSLNNELHKATITCREDNDKETRLRIPFKIRLE